MGEEQYSRLIPRLLLTISRILYIKRVYVTTVFEPGNEATKLVCIECMKMCGKELGY